MLIKWFSVWVLGSTFLLLSAAPAVHAQVDLLDQIVVTVDGSPITESEIERRIHWQKFLARNAGQANRSAEVLRRQAIEFAIDTRLQQNRAVDLQVQLTVNEVNERIASIIESSNVSEEQFVTGLASDGVSLEHFQQSIVESLLNDKLTERLVIPRIRIRDVEIDRYIEANRSEFLPVEEFDLSVIVVSESLSMNFEQKQQLRQLVLEIENELDRGADFAQLATAVAQVEAVQVGNLGWVQREGLDPNLANELSAARVNQIVGPVVSGNVTIFALVKRYRQGSSPDFPAIQEYHVARIILQASNEAGISVNAELLRSLRNTILNGGNFAEIAKVYSHDNISRKKGGDLGWISEDALPFEYLAPLAEMNVGDVSPVLQFDNIVFILQLRGRREASLEQRRRSYVRNRLRNIRLQNEHANWMDELRENAAIEFRTVF